MLPKSNHGYSLRPRKPASRQPTTHASATLPAEVVLEIIEHVKANHDFSSLYAYSLVSLDWLYAMRSTLFTKMTITVNELNQFICLLASPCCSLTHHVRELCARQDPAWEIIDSISGDTSFAFNGYAGRISNIMQLLPNATRLSLHNFDFTESLRYHQFHYETYAGFDQIDTLVLRDGICEARPFALEEVLSSFPRVRTLECDVLSLLDVKTYLFSRGLALRHPSAQYLPELTELSIIRPQVDLVNLITRCMSLQNIKILNYDWGSDLPEKEAEAVFSMLRSIGPTLEHLSFTGCMESSMMWQNGGWDFKHNTNLHTLSLQIDTPDQMRELGRLMDTMIISPLRTLGFIIFSASIYSTVVEMLLHGHRLTRALKYRDDVYGGLERLTCNVHIREFENKEETVASLRHTLDPASGKRRWWERGILKMMIETVSNPSQFDLMA